MMGCSNFYHFSTSQPYLVTADFDNKGDDTDVRYGTYRPFSLLVRYSTSEYRPCNTNCYRQTQLCCQPSNSTKYKLCKFKMHNLIKLLKVFLLSFIIIMTGTNGYDTTQRSNRLLSVNNGNKTPQDQGTEAEQYDALELAAQQAALLPAMTEENQQEGNQPEGNQQDGNQPENNQQEQVDAAEVNRQQQQLAAQELAAQAVAQQQLAAQQAGAITAAAKANTTTGLGNPTRIGAANNTAITTAILPAQQLTQQQQQLAALTTQQQSQ